MRKKLKLRRHESFSIREGWIEKGLRLFELHGQKTFSKENGTKILGLGSNMVKSLKYWMVACGLLEGINPTKETEFATLLTTYDPYLDSMFSWWLIHYMLVTNKEDSPVLYYAFNNYKGKYLDKDSLKQEICNYFNFHKYEYSEKLVAEDCQMVLRLYFNEDKKNNPEDNFISPLAKLNLLEKSINNETYIKKAANFDSLHYLIVFYALEKIYDDAFEIADAYTYEQSPARVFNLDRSVFEQYIGIMRNKGLITLNKTAGLNMVYIDKKLSLTEIIDEYRKEGGYVV